MAGVGAAACSSSSGSSPSGRRATAGRARRRSGPRRSRSAWPARRARARACTSRAARRPSSCARRSAPLVDEGELTDAEILGSVAQAYGARVLLVPRATGFDALAWALPAAAFVCAVAGLAVTFRRWRREAGEAEDPTDDDRELWPPPSPARTARRRPPSTTTGMNPDQLAELEDERRFLLRSLRDLDAELAAGDVDRGRLRDAARRLHEARRRRAARHRGGQGGAARRSDRAALGAGGRGRPASCVVVAVGVGILAARSSGERTAGDTITGGVPGREDTAALLSQARGLLGGDPRLAQDAYPQVLERDPDNPEALTYRGWLLYFASAGASDELAGRGGGDGEGAARPRPSPSTRRTPTRTASSPSSPPTPTPTWRRPAPRPTPAWRTTRRPRSASSSRACSTRPPARRRRCRLPADRRPAIERPIRDGLGVTVHADGGAGGTRHRG